MIRPTRRGVVKDPMTAKILGLLFLVFPGIIDGTILMGARARGETRPGHVLVALLPSLPLFAIGAWLIRKGFSMRDPEE